MTADEALQILYDALTGQTPDPVGGDAPAPLVMPGSTGHLSFKEWCKRLGLPRHRLDRYIRKELGCSGSELVRTLSTPRRH